MSTLTIPVTKHDHIQGNFNAPCSLVEYGDYECPSCGAVQPVIKRLQAHFGDQLSFVFRNFPLRQIHPWAIPAAELAECAGSLRKFWEMHDLLFANQERLNEGTFRAICKKLELTDAEMIEAQSSGSATKRIAADFAGGIRSGVNGTPTFFMNGQRYDGSTDFDSLVEFIDQILASDGE
jgi:protein-disulfide isomerase